MTKSGIRLIFSLLIVICVFFNALPIMATATPLRIQMYNGNTAAQINTVFPWFKITNTGSAPVNLAEVKIRYYYTIDGEKPQNFWCDWSNIGSGNVTGTFVKLETPSNGADYYFELGFKSKAGSLKPGKSVEAQNRFAKSDWSNYNQTNDYSFNPKAKTYVDWEKITVRIGDAIITTHDYAFNGQWVNVPVTIRLTATGGSGNLTTYYKINNGPAVAGDLIQLDEDGEYSVGFWSADSFGNSETPQSLTVKLDQAPPLLEHLLSPAPNATGWHNRDVSVSYNATDGLSGVGTVTLPMTVTTEGAGQVVNGSATDLAGNSIMVAVKVNLDKTVPLITNLQPADGAQINQKRPVISAGVFDELAGIDPASVRLTLNGQLVNGSYDVASGIISYTPVTDLTSSSHTITLKAVDLAGNPAVTASSSFTILTLAPITTHDYPHDGQWVNTPVTINFSSTSLGNGDTQIYYRINSGADIAGDRIQFSDDGIYIVQYWAVDQAGNTEIPQSLTVKLDQTLPTINTNLTPASNSAGWNNNDVTVTFSGVDELSGIATVTEPLKVTTEGLGWVIQGQIVDRAGNAAETSVTVNLDKTVPVITNLQPANGVQLNLKRPTISARIFDELSGIDPASIRVILDGQLMNGSYDFISGTITYIPDKDLDSGSHTITLNATDLAGNSATPVSSSFVIVTSTLVTTHDYLYDGQWVNTPVTINFTTTSRGNGVAQIYYRLNEDEPVAGNQIQFTIDGIYVVEYWAIDQEENMEIPKSITVKLDQALPMLTSSLTPAPNSNGWNNTDVIVSFTGIDTLSGIVNITEPVQVRTEGSGQLIKGQAVDQAGNAAETSVMVNLDKNAPVISSLQPVSGAQINQRRPMISAEICDDLSGTDPASVQLILDGQLVSDAFNTASGIISYTPATDLSSGSHSITLTAIDLAGNPVTASSSFRIITSDPNLPPDPAEVAPVLDPTIVSDLKTATNFLYTGDNPIQTGMDPETIEPRLAAVIRGKVLDKDGQPLPGVKVSILNHMEYGQTLSRADGMFDLAINGGGYLTVKYEKNDYLSAQRQVNVPWQDYVWTPEVILVRLDTKVTEISLTETAQAQVAQGSVITDEDGVRQATVIFPAGTKVTGLNNDIIRVRATEYTVGSNGPKMMPAILPSNVAYTYCVDLSIDEAENVTFNQPVYFYVDNFLNFPVGGSVPTGYYDKTKSIWIPSDSGLVIRVISINNNNLAEIDVNGFGQPADEQILTNLGFTDTERQKIASLYQPGQSLWRVPIKHFSVWDCNWGFSPPANATSPNQPKPKSNKPEDENCEGEGSIIEIQSQVLREAIPVTGTSFSLNYASNRVPGRTASNSLTIPLSGENVSSSLKGIELEVSVAGRQFLSSFSNQRNQKYVFTWDGKDAYGRYVLGTQNANVKIGYTYNGVYEDTDKFGYDGDGTLITGSTTRQEVTLWQEFSTAIGSVNIKDQGLGGWTLSEQHFYDPLGKMLYLGTGERVSSDNQNILVINTIAGKEGGFVGDGKPAIETQVYPQCIDLGPDGSIYFGGSQIRRIDPEGIVETIIENDADSLVVGDDGSIYFSYWSDALYHLSPNGVLTEIAGGGSTQALDNVPAKETYFYGLRNFTLMPDGSIYLTEDSYHQYSRIHKINPDGILITVAGNDSGRIGDGYFAKQTILTWVDNVIYGINGEIYFGDGYSIRKIGLDGRIRTIARTESIPYGLSLNPINGYLYYIDVYGMRICYVTPDGIVNTIAGAGTSTADYSGDGIAATASFDVDDLCIEPDGNILIAGNDRIRRISSAFPGFSASDITVPSKDGSELYKFSPNGKHVATYNAITGTLLYSFLYNTNGYLTSIIDGDGNITTIERDVNGNPMAIIAPFGQKTLLSVNSDGYLESITNSAMERIQLTYQEGGLLETFTNTRNGVHHFTYDDLGRLIRDEDPAGGYTELQRAETTNGYQITKTQAITSSSAVVSTYLSETLPNEDKHWFVKGCCGEGTDTIVSKDGSRKTISANGNIITTVEGSDPRFGMQAPIIKSMTVTTPGGLKYEMTGERTAELEDPNNPLSLLTQTDTTTINGKTHTTVYDAATRTVTSTTPMGRQSVTTLDEKGRVVKVVVPGLAPVVFEYDELGRLLRITEGTGTEARVSMVVYASNGLVDYITDPLGRQTRFEYDPVGRVTRQILPGGKQISFVYDSNGNMTELTPPGKPEHGFSYNAVDLNDTYTPPEVGIGDTKTEYDYNLAKQTTIVTRPDGKTIGFTYDTSGRLQELLIPEGEITYAYHADTGNLTNIFAPDGTMSYSYDGSLLNKTAWSGTVVGNVGVTYNNDFMVTSQSVNDGNTVSYGYDDDGLLASAGSLTISRDTQNGMMTGSTIGSVSDNVAYNGFGELRQYQAKYSGSTVYSLDYGTRDKLGRIVTKTETINGETHTYSYVYDPNTDELTDVYQDGALVSHYDYDANGNRVRYTGADGTFNGTYDDQDRLLSYGGNTYQYTANGELKSKTNTEGTTVYDYDVLGNLRAVTLADGTKVEYLIDGQNRRIGKKVNGALVQGFLYKDQLNPVAELDGSGNVVARFVYGTGVNVPNYVVKGGVTYRIITDHLGSPRVIINVATGEIVQRMDFDEFGKVMLDTNPGFQPFGFAGGLYDYQTGLVRFGARDYDVETGRWTCKDPIGFGGNSTNLYSYCSNEPNNQMDPSGLSAALGDCLLKCAADHYGLGDLVARGTVTAASMPISKRALGIPVIGPSSKTTNILSYLGLKIAPNFRGPIKILGTNRIFGIAGRAVPYLGMAIAAYDAASIGICTHDCMKNGDCDSKDDGGN